MLHSLVLAYTRHEVRTCLVCYLKLTCIGPRLYAILFKPIIEEPLVSLLNNNWKTKIGAMDDIIKSKVLQPSITFKYHKNNFHYNIGRETLYTTFFM